jgi:hypothetical protein
MGPSIMKTGLSRLRLVQKLDTPLVHRWGEASLLTPEQQRAVKEILASTAGILALEARAGTGKTSRVLATVRMAAEDDAIASSASGRHPAQPRSLGTPASSP